jgi:hypothetical protein
MKFVKEFDYIGTFMLTLGLLLFLMGLSWGGSLHPWKSAHVIGTLVAGLLLLIAFGCYETFVPLKEPLLPVHLLNNRGLILAILLWSIGASVYYAFAIVWPGMLITLYADKHTDPMWSGYAALALNGGISFGEIIGSLTKKRIHNTIQIVFALGAALLAGEYKCYTSTSRSPTDIQQQPQVVHKTHPDELLPLCFSGPCSSGGTKFSALAWQPYALKISARSAVLLDLVVLPDRLLRASAQRESLLQQACIARANKTPRIYTVILTNKLVVNIPAQVPPAVINAGLPETSVLGYMTALTTGNATGLAEVVGINPTIIAAGARAYKDASTGAYKTVFLSTIAFSAVGIICTFFLPNIDHLLTGEVSTTLHDKEEEVVGKKMDVTVVEEKV